MRIKFLKHESYILTAGFVAISCLATSLVAGIQGFSDGLWILPVLYFCCFALTFCNQNSHKYSVVIMNLIAYVRYVLLTYMYYYVNDDYVLKNGATILYYVPEKMSKPMNTTMAMCLEMVVFYVCINLSICLFFKEEAEIEIKKDKKYGLITVGLVFAGMLLLMIYPQLLGIYRLILKADASNIWGLFSILVYMARVCVIVWLVRCIRRKQKGVRAPGVILTCLLFGILTIEGAVGLTGLVSRWGFILMGIPCIYLLQKSYPKYFGKILFGILILGGIALVGMTALRYDLINSNGEVGFIQRIINYKTFNSYFAGGVNMEIAQQAAQVHAEQIGFKTIMNDVFGACPFINKFLHNEFNNTTYFFNEVIYQGLIYGDQICPIGGQSIIYFSELGVGVLPGIFAILAVWFEHCAERSNTLFAKYVYAYNMGATAIIMCINVNIWFQYFWQKMLPLILLVSLDYKFSLRSNKRI